MRLTSIRLRNFKCFADSGEVALSPSLNIFVGQNDSGKSTLLEALTLVQPANPHRSLRTVPTRSSSPQSISNVDIGFRFEGDEVQAWCRLRPTFLIPGLEGGPSLSLRRYVDLTREAFDLACTYASGVPPRGLSRQLVPLDPNLRVQVTNLAHPHGVELRAEGEVRGNLQDFGYELAGYGQNSIYVFKAERMNIGECTVAGQSILMPNAANLADVLNQLSTRNQPQFNRLMGHVRTIFPHITNISAPLIGANTARILVWHTPVELEREDLAIPLAASGTGIGQVLAMLYVVVTSTEPRVVVIDEPQSFLHPGAVRKLLEILRIYTRHQYIITTHSPAALSLEEKDSIFLVKRGSEGSTLVALDAAKQEDMRLFLAEVGARLGDVFGADGVLWVEGATEEACFPILLRDLAQLKLAGVVVLGVLSTDELAARHTMRIWEIYRRLSGASTLMPPALAFVLDRENRSDRLRADMDRASQGLVRWLPHRMFENYLIEPNAIAYVVSRELREEPPISADQVSQWLATRSGERAYVAEGLGKYPDLGWRANVDGATLLEDLFNEVSAAKVPYFKVKHGTELTRFGVERRDPALVELAAFLRGVVSRDQ